MSNLLNHLICNQLEIRKVSLENLAAAPTSPVRGQIYFDTAIGREGVYNGSAWDYTPSASYVDTNFVGLASAQTISGAKTFSVSPIVPNQTAGNSSTFAANTAFVTGAISTYTGTVNTALALKADLASPALTGNPIAPTQAVNTNNTRIATTAYVNTSNRPTVNASRTTSQTIAHGALVTVLYNTVNIDTNSAYNASTGKFTVPTGMAGLYSISASAVLTSISSILILDVIVNGAVKATLYDVRLSADSLVASAGSCSLILSAGDVVEIQVYQSNVSATTRTLVDTTAAFTSSMTIYRLNT